MGIKEDFEEDPLSKCNGCAHFFLCCTEPTLECTQLPCYSAQDCDEVVLCQDCQDCPVALRVKTWIPGMTHAASMNEVGMRFYRGTKESW